MAGQAQTRKRKPKRSEFGGGRPNIVEVLNVLEKTKALPSAALGAPPKYVRILPTPTQDLQILETQSKTIASQNSNQSSAPSRTTEWRHKKREMEGAEGKPAKRKYTRTKEFNLCKKCGQPRITLNGHSQYRGVVYCPSFEKLSKDVWLLQMKHQKEK